eukprot:74421_1
MSSPKDSFDDVELTSFATEIIQELSNNNHPPLEPDDSNSFIHELANDIDEDTAVDMNLCPSYDSSNSFYLRTSPSSSTFPLTLTPTIVSSHCKLSQNDSFNHSLPPIPDPHTDSYSFINQQNQKRVANSHAKHKNTSRSASPNTSASTLLPHTHKRLSAESKPNSARSQHSQRSRFTSPFHPPPGYSTTCIDDLCLTPSNDTASVSKTSELPCCISPRLRAQQPAVCAVPQFSEFTDAIVIDLTPTNKNNDKRKKSKRKKVLFAENVKRSHKRKGTKTKAHKRGKTMKNIHSKTPKLRPKLRRTPARPRRCRSYSDALDKEKQNLANSEYHGMDVNDGFMLV